MDDKPKRIIVKKYKKVHGEHHGGSWKVAYADFVTAMMAFFLLLWLLSMVSDEKRAVLAAYFKDFSLFEEGGQSFMMVGGMKPMLQNEGGSDIMETGQESGGITRDEVASKVITGVEELTQMAKDQIFIDATEMGIRIQVVDARQNPIFAQGSDHLTEIGKGILGKVASILRNFPNEIIVEGHTDSSPFRNEQISNWELSTSRASAARRQLEVDGIDPDRVSRVVGFANKAPLIRDNLEDPRNRRISIVLLRGKKQKPVDRLDWLWHEPPA